MSANQPTNPTDLENIFEAFGDLFGNLFGQPRDHRVTLELTDDEAATGGRHEIAVTRQVACADCDGRGSARTDGATTACPSCKGQRQRVQTQGFFQVLSHCSTCRGRGHVLRDPCEACAGAGTRAEQAKIAIDVPPGATHEQTLTVVGAGARVGGVVGDLHVYLLVGGRPDSRATHFELPAELPRATIHRAKSAASRPPIVWFVGIALVALAVLVLLAR